MATFFLEAHQGFRITMSTNSKTVHLVTVSSMAIKKMVFISTESWFHRNLRVKRVFILYTVLYSINSVLQRNAWMIDMKDAVENLYSSSYLITIDHYSR